MTALHSCSEQAVVANECRGDLSIFFSVSSAKPCIPKLWAVRRWVRKALRPHTASVLCLLPRVCSEQSPKLSCFPCFLYLCLFIVSDCLPRSSFLCKFSPSVVGSRSASTEPRGGFFSRAVGVQRPHAHIYTWRRSDWFFIACRGIVRPRVHRVCFSLGGQKKKFVQRLLCHTWE